MSWKSPGIEIGVPIPPGIFMRVGPEARNQMSPLASLTAIAIHPEQGITTEAVPTPPAILYIFTRSAIHTSPFIEFTATTGEPKLLPTGMGAPIPPGILNIGEKNALAPNHTSPVTEFTEIDFGITPVATMSGVVEPRRITWMLFFPPP